MSWPRRESLRGRQTSNITQIHKSASFTQGANGDETHIDQDFVGDDVKDGFGNLENQLEKVLKSNKRGFHRKSTAEVTSSNQKDVHFGQRRQLGKGSGGISVATSSVAGDEEISHIPSTAIEGKMDQFGIICF